MKDTNEEFPKNQGAGQPKRRHERAHNPDLAELRRKIQTLCRVSEKQEEIVESLADWLDRRELIGKGDLGLQPWNRTSPLPGYPIADADELWQKLARLGVTVDIVREMDDWAKVTIRAPEIDESWKLCLPPTLADTLAALCEDSGTGGGDLVNWKSMSDLARGLLKRTGRAPSPRAITVRVSRLRRALQASGISRLLVQRSRQGFRFAKKAEAGPEIRGNMT